MEKIQAKQKIAVTESRDVTGINFASFIGSRPASNHRTFQTSFLKISFPPSPNHPQDRTHHSLYYDRANTVFIQPVSKEIQAAIH